MKDGMGMSTSEMEVEEGIGGTAEVNWRRNDVIYYNIAVAGGGLFGIVILLPATRKDGGMKNQSN